MATFPSELRHVLLVGPPGSGKGTVGPHLSELLGVPHVSSGQLLRASVKEGDPHHIGEQVARGHLVPDRIVVQVIVPDEVASARLSRRARMESRSDDNPDTVAARLVTYRREAVALLAHYADRVRRVNASGDLDEVFERAERALSSLPKGARAGQA